MTISVNYRGGLEDFDPWSYDIIDLTPAVCAKIRVLRQALLVKVGLFCRLVQKALLKKDSSSRHFSSKDDIFGTVVKFEILSLSDAPSSANFWRAIWTKHCRKTPQNFFAILGR